MSATPKPKNTEAAPMDYEFVRMPNLRMLRGRALAEAGSESGTVPEPKVETEVGGK